VVAVWWGVQHAWLFPIVAILKRFFVNELIQSMTVSEIKIWSADADKIKMPFGLLHTTVRQ
jgi:hypothetical protein